MLGFSVGNQGHAKIRVQPMAEGVGFEPTVACATHAFQACRFGRSRTPPGAVKSISAQRAEWYRLPLSWGRSGLGPGLECDGRVLCNTSP